MTNLPKPNDPYITGDGKVIQVTDDGEQEITTAEVYNAKRKIQHVLDFQPARDIELDQIPEADHSKQAVIAAVVALRLMGLSVIDISKVIGTEVKVIYDFLKQDAAQATFEAMFRSIVSINSNTVQGRIASFADNAASVIVSLMNDEEQQGMVRLKSAQDVLDRSGTNAEQFFRPDAKEQSQDDELNIVFTTGDEQDAKVELSVKRKGR